MGVDDSWISATAMALDIPVLTRDDRFAALDEPRHHWTHQHDRRRYCITKSVKYTSRTVACSVVGSV